MGNEPKMIELSIERRIYEVLQLDSSRVRNFYGLFPSRPDSKRNYYKATAEGWRKVIDDLLYRSGGGWDPDCAVPKSTAERLKARLERAAA